MSSCTVLDQCISIHILSSRPPGYEHPRETDTKVLKCIMCLIRQILTSSRDAASAPEDGPCRAPRPQVAAMRWQSKQLPPARHNPVVLTLECQNRAWNAHGATVRNMSLIPACQRSRRWRRAQSQDTWHKLLFLRHPRETIPHQPPRSKTQARTFPGASIVGSGSCRFALHTVTPCIP